jgi:hypothetical protein
MTATLVPSRQTEDVPYVAQAAAPGSTGTVEDVAVTAGTGISASVANATDHPNISIALAAIAHQRLLANVSGGSAAPSATTLTAILDSILGSTQGQIITRNGASWTVINPGTVNYPLISGGAGANVAYGILPVAGGGTGTASPGIVAGTNVTVSGTWPNQTVAAAGAYDPSVAHRIFGGL